MAENPPAPSPNGANLPPPPPPPPSGEQPEKTPPSGNKRLPTPALIGAAVAALAAIGIGATWMVGGSESVIRGANIIPGIDIGEPGLQVAAEKTTYLTELSGEQPPIPLVAGAGNALYGNVDPHSPHVFGQEVYRLEGTRFKALERPENLPDTYPKQIRHGYALISGSDQGESEEWFVWDLEAGTAEQFPMPEGTNWLQLVNPDLFLAAQIPPGQKTARFTAVDRNGNELWSKVPAALGLDESCERLPDIHPSGDYLSFSNCFTIVDAKSGTPHHDVVIRGVYPEGVICTFTIADTVSILSPDLSEVVKTFEFPTWKFTGFAKDNLEYQASFDDVVAAMEAYDPATAALAPEDMSSFYQVLPGGELMAVRSDELGFTFWDDSMLQCESNSLIVAGGKRMLCLLDDTIAAIDLPIDETKEPANTLEAAHEERYGAPTLWQERRSKAPEVKLARFANDYWLMLNQNRLYLLR